MFCVGARGGSAEDKLQTKHDQKARGNAMAKILVVGGGFGGIVAAESLAKKLGNGHEITLVSRSNKFVFYPALVRLAFGRATPEDICLLYTSDAADERSSVDLGGR